MAKKQQISEPGTMAEETFNSDFEEDMIINAVLAKKELLSKQILKNRQEHQAKLKDASEPDISVIDEKEISSIENQLRRFLWITLNPWVIIIMTKALVIKLERFQSTLIPLITLSTY